MKRERLEKLIEEELEKMVERADKLTTPGERFNASATIINTAVNVAINEQAKLQLKLNAITTAAQLNNKALSKEVLKLAK